MVACRYEIPSSRVQINITAIELNTRREIAYLRAPKYYSLYNSYSKGGERETVGGF